MIVSYINFIFNLLGGLDLAGGVCPGLPAAEQSVVVGGCRRLQDAVDVSHPVVRRLAFGPPPKTEVSGIVHCGLNVNYNIVTSVADPVGPGTVWSKSEPA